MPLARYEEAWAEAVRVFGRNRVSTYLLIGLGEDPDELVAGARRLIKMGVYPFVVPYRPLVGALADDDGVPAPSHEIVAGVTDRVGRALRNAGMRGADQGPAARRAAPARRSAPSADSHRTTNARCTARVQRALALAAAGL